MFLNKLFYIVNGKVIREINFKKGMNFIVDETIDNKNETGNDVGKTTVLRIIDIVFGEKVEVLYNDSMGEVEIVRKFFQNNVIEFILVVQKKRKNL